MAYFNQTVLASGIVNDMLVTLREGLNFKDDIELRIQVPKEHPLFDAFNHGEYIYSQIDTGYFGTDTRTGQVSFFSYSEPSSGFGGYTYNLPMCDGSIATLIGPWSSRCGVMNAYGFTPSKEVTVESQYNMASAMTIDAINKLIIPLGYICNIAPRMSGDIDVRYDIVTLKDYVLSIVGVFEDEAYITACEIVSPNAHEFDSVHESCKRACLDKLATHLVELGIGLEDINILNAIIEEEESSL